MEDVGRVLDIRSDAYRKKVSDVTSWDSLEQGHRPWPMSARHLQVIGDGGPVGSINSEIEIHRGLARVVKNGAVGQLVGFEYCPVLSRTIFDLKNAFSGGSNSGHVTIPTEQNCIPLHLDAHSEACVRRCEATMQEGERNSASKQ
jgi:hypothetical protein